MKRAPILISTIVAALLMLMAADRVWGHGGGAPQLTNEPAGPYTISAWTNPDPPAVGDLHLTIGVGLAATGEALAEPEVVVTAFPPDGSDPTRTIATHEGALTPYFYETDLALSAAGSWRVEIDVEGKEGKGNAAFTLEVREAAPNYLLWGGIGLAAVVALWLGWTLIRK